MSVRLRSIESNEVSFVALQLTKLTEDGELKCDVSDGPALFGGG